jgi:hypothetical protein
MVEIFRDGLMAVMEFSVIYRGLIRSVYTAHITGELVEAVVVFKGFHQPQSKILQEMAEGGVVEEEPQILHHRVLVIKTVLITEEMELITEEGTAV